MISDKLNGLRYLAEFEDLKSAVSGGQNLPIDSRQDAPKIILYLSILTKSY